MNEQMREDFEAMMRNKYPMKSLKVRSSDWAFEYADIETQSMFLGYQAALSAVPANNPWQQAIDDELVNTHLGIAQDDVTREEAKAQLNNLIAWHIDVAKYFESQAQQPAQESWISVDERLPEANITVLVVTNFDCIYTCRLPVIISKNAALDLENGIRERFTHWMPLPLPPVSRSDEQPVKEVE
jgi:hypothetical protein